MKPENKAIALEYWRASKARCVEDLRWWENLPPDAHNKTASIAQTKERLRHADDMIKRLLGDK